MLSVPYLRPDGQCLTMRFRCLEAHDHRSFGHGKYNSMKGDPARTYNVGAIHTADEVIHVAEGELDALILCKVGLPAVAIPGASSWQGKHRRMLAGFSRIYVWADGDDAGAEMRDKICRQMRAAKGVYVPKGYDVTDLFLEGGAGALRSLVAKEDL